MSRENRSRVSRLILKTKFANNPLHDVTFRYNMHIANVFICAVHKIFYRIDLYFTPISFPEAIKNTLFHGFITGGLSQCV